MRQIQRSKAGIAEVVGAMLLIIITVVAIGSFAYYLNYTQNQAQNRQSFINSVKNENLVIQHIQLASYQIHVRQTVVCVPSGSSSPSNTCAFSQIVPAGDDVVVGAIDSSSILVSTAVDATSVLNIYSHVVSNAGSPGDVEAWFAPIKVAGMLSITVTWTSGTANGGIYLYDVSGVSQAIPTAGNFSSGSGTSNSPSVSPSYTPRANSLVIGILNSACVSSSPCVITAGGYHLDNFDLITSTDNSSSESGITTGTSESTPFALTMSSQFSEVSLALNLDVPTATPTPSLTMPISNFSITVQNLNTAQSQIARIQVDGIWLHNFYSSGFNYNGSYPLVLPAKSSAIVQVLTNFSSTSIYRNQALQIILLSASGNYFTTAYSPPTSIITVQLSTATITVQSTTSGGTTFTAPSVVDIPIFSGQQSQATNSTFLSNYFWTVRFNDTTAFQIGSTPSFAYTASLDYTQLNTLPTDYPNKGGYKGNFIVMLMTEDANGFTWTSSIVFPRDPNISPLT